MNQHLVLSEDDAFELLAFLITSARGCIDEPETYGTFRLIDAASRMIGFILESGQAEDTKFLRELKDEIDQKKLWLMTDEEGYFQFLRDVTRKMARQLKVRAGID
ncbi:MAG: DUF6092 family protein [Anaerolineae bacterium]